MEFRTLTSRLAVLLVLGFGAGAANATVIVDDPNNPGNACGVPCNFNFGTLDLSNVSIPAITLNSVGDANDRIIKNFGTLESAVFEGTISSLGSFSIYETITNNSPGTPPAFGGGGDWSGYTVDVEFFDVDVANGDSLSWSSTTIGGAWAIDITETGAATANPTTSFAYTKTGGNAPIGAGESFFLDIVFNADIDTTVGYRITQTPTLAAVTMPMPEPTGLALLGLGLAGLAARRKKA